MHVEAFVRGKGKFFVTEFVPTSERATRKYPLLLTTGRVLMQYNVGAQTRRTANITWASADRLEIHPHDVVDAPPRAAPWPECAAHRLDTFYRAPKEA